MNTKLNIGKKLKSTWLNIKPQQLMFIAVALSSTLSKFCVHALKVLDKKNIKKLPTHYILKRWTQEANVGSIKNYHGIDIKGNTQESLGKRYSYLCHNFCEVSILTVESEIMYDYAKRCTDTLLKDLQEMRKKCYSLSMEDQTKVHDEVVIGDVL